jgi:hypothetical protein
MKKGVFLLQVSFLLCLGFTPVPLFAQGSTTQDKAEDFFTYSAGVYISPQGSDYYEGTREHPFRTLKKAIDYLKISGKKTIYADDGTYYVDSTLIINLDVDILGSKFWKQDPAEKSDVVIESWEPYSSGGSLFAVRNARLTLKGLTVSDLHRHFQDIIKIEGGVLTCERVIFHYSSLYQSSAINQKDGVLELSNSEIHAHDVRRSTAVLAAHTTVKLAGVSITGSQNSEDFCGLVCTAGSDVSADNLSLNTGTGRRLTSLSIENSSLILRSSTLKPGAAAGESICVLGKNSKVTVVHNEFACDSSPYKVKAISTTGGSLVVHNCSFSLNAQSGVQGVYASGGDIDLQSCYFHTGTALEYYYAVQLEGTKGGCFNNIVEGGDSADSVNIMLNDSGSKWINNTIIGRQGSNITVGIIIRGATYPVLINNIISRKEPATGIALYVISSEERSFYALANNISGWDIILQYANVPDNRNYTAITTTIKTIEEFNHYDLVPFGGTIDINISEVFDNTFEASESAPYGLRASSRCVNAGLDVNTQQFGGPRTDFAGNPRPDLKGDSAIYDIGAFEFQSR